MDDEEIKQNMIKIYEDLSGFKGIRFVGATKIMHLMCPHFFVMWDTAIRKHYKCGTSPKEYYKFMKEMQRKYKEQEFEDLEKGVTLPRAIDLYNITRFSPS